MWGWKTAERVVEPSISFDEAKRKIQRHGFELITSNPKHGIFKLRGIDNGWTKLAPQGENLPLELAVAESDRGLFIQLRYDHFVLFDTGDLQQIADELASELAKP
jgi:hypothetical protein